MTVRRLAREYNAGLAKAVDEAQRHNAEVVEMFKSAGVKCKFVSRSLLPMPQPCPEDLGMNWVRKFLKAYSWRKTSRNTAGQYLETWNGSPATHKSYVSIPLCVCVRVVYPDCFWLFLCESMLRSGKMYASKLRGAASRRASRRTMCTNT